MDRRWRVGSASASGTSFAHQPALDGVRAVAVIAVLLFHAGFPAFSGGYVGVSVFFTLSGYLITSLALVEHAATGRLDVGAFYARRICRLLPASVLCVVGVAVLAWAGLFEGVPHLRRSAWAALGQVYNWVALGGGESYADLISGDAARARPLEHYWSLAIEEQFYWVWPLALAVILRRPARGRLATIAVLTVAAAVAAPVIAAVWGPDAAYWATPARLAEILVGALLATVLHLRRGAGARLPRSTWMVSIPAAGVVVWAATTWPAGSGPAYDGWFPAFAVASGALILGLQVDGPLRRVLSWAPLVALGAISYGVYLFHWPIYAVLDEQRVDLGRVPLFAVRAAVTLAVATASYVLLERPIRRSTWTVRPVSQTALAGCAAVAIVVAVAPVERAAFYAGSSEDRAAVAIEPAASLPPLAPAEPPTITLTPTTTSTTTASVPAGTAAPGSTVGTTTTSTAPAGPVVVGRSAEVPRLPTTMTRPARLLLLGDSTVSAIGEGMVTWAKPRPELAQVTIRWAPGCGFLRVGAEEHEVPEYRAACEDIRARLADDIATLQPDVVLLMVTIGDTEGRIVTPGGPVVRPGQPAFTELIDAEYERFYQDLTAMGATRIAWVIPPTPIVSEGSLSPQLAIPERWTTLRAAVDTVAARHPDVVTVVDMDAWQRRQPTSGRPDGIHYSAASATEMAEAWLAPALLDVALS